MGVKEDFAAGYIGNDIGKLTGVAAGVQLPDLARTLIRFKADASNNCVFLIGENPENCFYPISAGDDTGWIPIQNLNEFHVICVSGSANFLYYWTKV